MEEEQLTNIRVFALPPIESCISLVKRFSLYLMKLYPSANADITFPRDDKD
jgi:hypothetical protein